MAIKRKLIGEMLIDGGAITESQLEEALEEQKKSDGQRLGIILVKMGAIDQKILATYLARQTEDSIGRLKTS